MKRLLVCFCFFFSCLTFGQEVDSLYIKIAKELKTKIKRTNFQEYMGEAFPDFGLQNIRGNPVSSESLKGRPTVINLWSIYCAPCVAEIPVLNNFSELYKGRVNFVAMTFDKPDDVTDFLERNPFEFVHVVGSSDYLRAFGFFGIPQTIVLDQDFKGVWVVKNALNEIEAGTDRFTVLQQQLAYHLNLLLE
jgi:thiol-disulfide isomerase/thioredoxin